MSSMGNIGLNLVVHELAHQWFGDARTLGSWRDLWLNEGFATQAEMLYLEARQPAFDDEYNFLFPLYRDRALQAEGTLTLQDTVNVNGMFAFPRVYGKGFMVLRMLRTLVGDETYRHALHAYMAGRDEPATPEALQAALETASGQDLNTFFDAWVHTGWGHPELAHAWSSAPDGAGWTLHLTVRQVQEHDASNIRAFPMPLPVRIAYVTGTDSGAPSGSQSMTRDTLLVLSRTEETFHLRIENEPLSVTLDPEKRSLWVDAAAATSTASQPRTPGTALDVYPNPARDGVYVRLGSAGMVRIVDVLGRVVVEQHLSAGTHWLQLAHLPSGTYVIESGSGSAPVYVL